LNQRERERERKGKGKGKGKGKESSRERERKGEDIPRSLLLKGHFSGKNLEPEKDLEKERREGRAL